MVYFTTGKGLLSLPFITGHKIFPELGEIPIQNSLSHIAHELEQEIQIVNRNQSESQKLSGLIQMTDIRPAVMLTGVAAAAVL